MSSKEKNSDHIFLSCRPTLFQTTCLVLNVVFPQMFVNWRAFLTVSPRDVRRNKAQMSHTDILLESCFLSFISRIRWQPRIGATTIMRFHAPGIVRAGSSCSLIYTNTMLCYWFLTKGLNGVWSDGAFGICTGGERGARWMRGGPWVPV